MTLHNLHIVAARDGKDAVKTLYVGDDAVKAEAAYEAANDSMAVVGIINFPQFSRQRYPQADVERAKEREQAALSATESEQKAREIKAANLRLNAEKLLVDAEKLHPAEKPAEKSAEELRAEAKTLLEQAELIDPKKKKNE